MRILWDAAPLIVWATSPMAIKGLIEYPEFYQRLARERQQTITPSTTKGDHP